MLLYGITEIKENKIYNEKRRNISSLFLFLFNLSKHNFIKYYYGGYMKLERKNIGFIFTGAFKSINCSIEQLEKIIKMKNTVYPIMSYSAYKYITNDTKKNIIEKSNNKIIHNYKEMKNLDIVLIEPCTSNTLSKLANNIVDTPVLYIANMALNLDKPLVIGISCFNNIASTFENIGKLINKKNVYFIPFRQTNPITRPNYIMFDPNLTIDTMKLGLNNIQIQPILI